MRTLFLCFTPYHIKVANWFIGNKIFNDDNYIILSSFTGIKFENLRLFVKEKLYRKVYYCCLHYSGREIIKKPIYYSKIHKKELSEFLSTVREINPDVIFYFSDNPIPYQMLLKNMKEKGKKLVFVEEGMAFYIDDGSKSNLRLKEKISFNIRKILFGFYEAKLYPHGYGNFENVIIAREPQLKKSNAVKYKIEKSEFKVMISEGHKKDVIEAMISEPDSILFCPTNTTYNYKIRDNVYDDIFNFYYQCGRKVYVKLHPAEKKVEALKSIIDKYNGRVELLQNYDITSEDLILCNNITEIVSDMSSSLVSAYYLRNDIKIYTYIIYLYDKYKIRLQSNYTIFKYLYNNGYIKNLILR